MCFEIWYLTLLPPFLTVLTVLIDKGVFKSHKSLVQEKENLMGNPMALYIDHVPKTFVVEVIDYLMWYF